MAIKWNVGRGRVLITTVVITVVLAGIPAASVTASAQPTEINSCTVIDQPGRYVLTTDIMDSTATNCIHITSSNVVFDGQGYTIDSVGDGDGRRGIFVHNDGTRLTNVTVRDVTVTNWRDAGIEFESVDSGKIANTTAIHNLQDGIDLTYADNTTVVNNNASANEYFGITLIISTNNTIKNNYATANGRNGIDILYSANNYLVGNNASGNHNDGLRLYGSAHTVLEDNVMNSNGRNGITSYYYSYNNTYANTTVVGNGGWAYYDVSSPQRFDDPLWLSNTVKGLDLGETTISFEAKDIALKPNESAPEPPTGTVGIGMSLIVTNTSEDAFLDIKIPYTEQDVVEVNESTLQLWQYDGSWSTVPGSGVNVQENYVYANITDFSGINTIAPVGSPSGITPDITVAPMKLTFLETPGRDVTTRTIIISNTGLAPLDVTSLTLTGPDASAFSITDNNAPFTLAPGEIRQITVEFTLSSTDTADATVQIESNAPDEPIVIVSLSSRTVPS